MKHQGFIDLQLNGYKNIDFSSPQLTLDQVRTATRELVKAGTLAYCPTLVTGPMDHYRHALSVFADAMRDPELASHLLGIHLEGPFISPLEGARGAHPPEHIVPPSIAAYDKFQEWAEGHIAILTLAPEIEGALPLIRHAVKHGTLISVGHHLADDTVLEQAVAAGARACTHLGNGMPNLINRHQNPLWWELACDDLTGMFITDGHHLPADFIKVALRAKTLDRFIVVSDASHLAGLLPGTYEFHGVKVVLAPSGRIGFADTPYLAGASATMFQCMNHLASLRLLSEAELWRVGFKNPLRWLGRKPDALAAIADPTVTFNDGQFVLSKS